MADFTPWLTSNYNALSGMLGYSPNVTSGVRTAAHNTAVGGAPSSWHVQGQALDLTPGQGQTMSGLYKDILGTGIDFRELLNEGDHVHVAFPEGGITGAAKSTLSGIADKGKQLGALALCWAKNGPVKGVVACASEAGAISGNEKTGQAVEDAIGEGLVDGLKRAGIFILAVVLIAGAIALLAGQARAEGIVSAIKGK